MKPLETVRNRPPVHTLLLTAAVLTLACGTPEPPPPVEAVSPFGMVGELTQLHRLDLLPSYRTGSVVAQVSSYDTTGGNNDGFSGLYSFVRREGGNLVLAELEGPGVVHRIWTPTPTESMVAFYFDGEDVPRLKIPFIDLFSGEIEPFLPPLVGNEIGGYYAYVPIPYSVSLKIVYEGQDIRFHQIQYRQYPPGTEVESFRTPLSRGEAVELEAAREAWARAGKRPWGDGLHGGSDVGIGASQGSSVTESPAPAGAEAVQRAFALEPGGRAELFRMEKGGRILGLEVERDGGPGPWGRGIILQITFDGQDEPAVLSPMEDFFGYAYGRVAARSLLIGSTGERDYAYLPMPFQASAVVSLAATEDVGRAVSGRATVFYSSLPRDPAREGQLFTAWRREVPPTQGEPYLLLDVAGRGHHVGTLLQAQGMDPGMTVFFEGDDVTTVDGQMRLHGTGSEDYFNGGWYALLDRWDDGVSLPLHGSLEYSLPLSRTGGYRFYLADKVSFEESYRLTIEHGPEGNQTPVDYTSLTFYYGEAPSPHRMDPASNTSRVRTPGVHEFFPQLLSVALRAGTTLDYSDRRYLEIRAEEEGLARIDVGEVPPGTYRVFLTYERGPTGAAFSLWRRQVQASDWIDSFSDRAEPVERAYLGEVELTDQIRTLTLRTRTEGQRRELRIMRLVLEEG